MSMSSSPNSGVPTSSHAFRAMTASPPTIQSLCAITLLGFRAEVSGPESVVRALRDVFPSPPPWTMPDEASIKVAFRVQFDTPFPGLHRVVREGSPPWTTDDPVELLPYLVWIISMTAVEHLRARYLLLHAGAVAYDGSGIVLPAASGSGKSTLTAALVASGCRYISDEVAALEIGTRQLVPFARSLCLKRGGFDALAAQFPCVVAGIPRRQVSDRVPRYLPLPDDTWPQAPVPVRLMVFPRYEPGARTVLRPLARPDALLPLLAQSLGTHAFCATDLGSHVDLLRYVECFSLTFDDLREAVEMLQRVAH